MNHNEFIDPNKTNSVDPNLHLYFVRSNGFRQQNMSHSQKKTNKHSSFHNRSNKNQLTHGMHNSVSTQSGLIIKSSSSNNQSSSYYNIRSNQNQSIHDIVYSENYLLRQQINEVTKFNKLLKVKLDYSTNQLQQYEQQLINKGHIQAEDCIFNVSTKNTVMQQNPEHLLLKQQIKNLLLKLDKLENEIKEQNETAIQDTEIKKSIYELAFKDYISQMLKGKITQLQVENSPQQVLNNLRLYKEQLNQKILYELSRIDVEMFSQQVLKEQTSKINMRIKYKNRLIQQVKATKQYESQKFSEITYSEQQNVQKFSQIFFMNKQRNKNNMFNIDTVNELEHEQVHKINKQEKQIDSYNMAIQQQTMMCIINQQNSVKLITRQKDKLDHCRREVEDLKFKILIGEKNHNKANSSVRSNDITSERFD